MHYWPLYIAIIIYALFSSPTPDVFGWAEWSIAALLIANYGLIRGFNTLFKPFPPTLSYHRLFLLFMLTYPMVLSAFYGNHIGDIIRDLIPLAFLFLPLMAINKNQKTIRYFIILCAFIGVCFAIRYFMITKTDFFNIGFNAASDNLLYLVNSPLVPFTAIIGFSHFIDPNKKLFFYRFLGLFSAVICFIAMAVMIQRAPFTLSVCACLIITMIRFPAAPWRIAACLGFLLFALMPVFPLLIDIADSFINKSFAIGMNSRVIDFVSAIDHGGFFGKGWGAVWQSPAVGDYWVRYTHNMVSYYWLKAGVFGGIAALGFIIIWLVELIKIIKENIALGFALAVPFLIHVTLYTGYKTLDFALIILLIALYACKSQDNFNHQSNVSANDRRNRTIGM